jgi:uncharacterized protein YxjI
MDIASITKQQSLLIGERVTSWDRDLNASLIKPGSHLNDEDYFLIKDGFGKGIMERTYLYAFGE